jgi:N-acetylglucosaminyldiphosphoundecaprenol N-acetyl-beta-D-mannosaminyltransferase
MSATPKTFSVLQLPVHLLGDYTSWLIERLQQQAGAHVVTLNAEMAMLAGREPLVARAIRQAELVIPDGAGIVLYLRLQGQRQQRCPGIELAQSLLEKLGPFGRAYPIAFYGGKPGVAEAAAREWRRRIPEIAIWASHGYLSPAEEEQWRQHLRERQPKLVFVGLGVPRQEFWIQENRHLCPQAIWIGVGGSFDIWSGNKSRAPAWFCRHNLEWLYRLYQEPWRWRRMLALPQFFWLALLSQPQGKPHTSK